MTLELGTRLGAYDAGGDSMPIIRGDEVAVDPSTGDLVVLRRGNVGQLVRVPAAGGAETPIDVVGDWRVLGSGGVTLMGHAVASDGRVVIRTLPPASWMFPSGTLDSRRGGRIIPFLDLAIPIFFRPGGTVRACRGPGSPLPVKALEIPSDAGAMTETCTSKTARPFGATAESARCRAPSART
jgi:hypothetical protein